MKISPYDFILSGLTIIFLIFASLLVVKYGINPWIISLVPYQGIISLTSFLIIYGILAGLSVQLILLIWPVEPGEHDMKSWAFRKFIWISMLTDTGFWALRPFRLLALTPLFLILFGAKVGKNLGSGGNFSDPHMVRLGQNVIIGNGSEICGNTTYNGKIKLGYVHIGNDVTIGMHTTVLPNTKIGDGAMVLIGSVVMPDTIIPPGEIWRGNPARKWQ